MRTGSPSAPGADPSIRYGLNGMPLYICHGALSYCIASCIASKFHESREHTIMTHRVRFHASIE
jgi:hypothetical protein